MEDEKKEKTWPLIGNSHIIEFLTKSIISNNIAGSYIFIGPDDLGKATVANYFARSLACQKRGPVALPCGNCPSCQQAQKGIHSDIYLIKKAKDKKNITIDQVREFIRSLSMSSFLNSYKIGIIRGAQDLSLSAMNALLKTLEEPKEKVVIILTVSSLELLPETIVSRSQILRFRPVSSQIIYDHLVKNYKAPRSLAKNFSQLCLGRPALAAKFFEDKEFYENYKMRSEIFINFFQQDINERLLVLKKMIGTDTYGQESVSLAKRIIETWQGIVRDIILVKLDQTDLIQHQIFEEKLMGLRAKFSFSSLINLHKNLKQAEEFIKSNVSPKLVMENLAINLPLI